jgi:hypothetical protein
MVSSLDRAGSLPYIMGVLRTKPMELPDGSAIENRVSDVHNYIESLMNKSYEIEKEQSAKFLAEEYMAQNYEVVLRSYKKSKWYQNYLETGNKDFYFNEFVEWVKGGQYYYECVVCKYDNMDDVVKHLKSDYESLN